MTKSILLKGKMVFVLSFLSFLTFAQQKIGTNPGALNPGAILELESSNKGFLPPRLALSSTTTWGLSGSASASAIFGGQTAAADGMMVYNTATAGTAPNNVTPGFYIWTGGAAGSWKRLNTVSAVTNANGLALDANGVLSYSPSTNSIPATAITGANVTAGSNRVTLGGTPTGAALSPFSVDINEANLNLANVGGTLPLTKLQAGTAGQELVMVGTTPTWVTPSASTAQNIYTTNGTLSGNRSIFMGSNTMAFDTTTLVIDPNTNRIGIGTATPHNLLTLRTRNSVVSGVGTGEGITISSGGAGSIVRLRAAENATEGIGVGGVLELQSAASITDVILRTGGGNSYIMGNLGLGTSSPTQQLHVTGNALVSGLGGTGTRMVVADANGLLSTQAIPTGTVTGAANGLSLVSGNAELGGTLTKPTTITTSATNLLSIAGLQAKTVQNDTNDSLMVVTGSGALRYRSVASVSPIASVTSGNGLTLTSGVLAFSPVANSIPATAITGANVTAGSNRVTLGGTPTGAALSPFSVDINEANLNLANVGGTLPLSKLQAGTAGQELVMVGTTPTWVTPSASTAQNIYTTDGTLSGNRTVNLNNNLLQFITGTGSGNISFDRGHAPTNARIASQDTLEFQAGSNAYQLALMSTGNVYIGSESSAPNYKPNPTSRIDLNGSVSFNIRRVTAATTLDITDRTVLANAFASGFTITLPAPSTCMGREYIIRKTDESSNAITFTFTGISGSNAIRVSDTSATAGSYINTLNYVKTLRIQSDGIDWYLVD